MMKNNHEQGFTLLFAALVGALVLAVGMAILSITIKQLTLASAGKATQQAFYSADAGVECALYLDRGAGLENCRLGFFPIPDGLGNYTVCSNQSVPPAGSTRCLGKSILINDGGIPEEIDDYTIRSSFVLNKDSSFSGDSSSSGGIADNGGMCFGVTVTKKIDNLNTPSVDETATIIESRGYNTCNEQAVNRFERAIRSVNQ